MKQRKITKVEYVNQQARVILDDGSELVGISYVASEAGVDNTAAVKLTARIMPEPKISTFENILTGERVHLTKQEKERFFDNRHPAYWGEV